MYLSLNKKYFEGDISRGFISLYIGKTVIMIASGLLGLFLPIFVFNLLDQNFVLTILYFVASSVTYGFLVISGAQFLNSFGFRRSLRASVLFGALFYVIFYFIDKGNMEYFLPLSILVITFFRLLHWVPYHTDFAKFTDKKNRGKELSSIMATGLAISVFIPLAAGAIITKFGFEVLFFIAIILYLVAIVPFATLPHTQEKFVWSYKKTWKEFFSKKRRGVVFAHMANGAENLIGVIIWPIFMFQILDGNYFNVGAISTLVISVTVVFQLIVGKYLDKPHHKDKVLGWGCFLYSAGWLAKIFITTAFQIFVAGAYHSIAHIFFRTPDTLTYEMAADEGHYVDEFTVIKEMAVHFGKIIAAALIILLSMFFALQWTFLLAAMATLVLVLLRSRGEELKVSQ